MEKFIIDDRIFSVKFSCDLERCKGACCTLKGAGGAPILNEEVSIIKSNAEKVKKYLHKVNMNKLDEEGFLDGSSGEYSIKSINDEDCIFSFIENGIARCSFERAYLNNEINFRKPLSCHLFPVRIKGKHRNQIRYEEISECRAALLKGAKEDITIFEFCRESIIRQYGEDFYNDLSKRYLKKDCNAETDI